MASERPYELTLAPEFEAEADKASDWWAKHRPAAPHLFEDELDAALLRISAFWRAWVVGGDQQRRFGLLMVDP